MNRNKARISRTQQSRAAFLPVEPNPNSFMGYYGGRDTIANQQRDYTDNGTRSKAVVVYRGNSSANRRPPLVRLARPMMAPSLPLMTAPVAYSSLRKSSVPKIVASRGQSHIVHRELISNITGTTAWSVSSMYSLNPGIFATFPWLSSQASAWEFYHFNSLSFHYISRTGTNIPGSIALVPDYDAADAAPISEQASSSYEDMAENVVWKDLRISLKSRNMHPNGRKFVRTTTLAANLDIKTYDAGNLFVCTNDGTAVSWGKLWVEYDVILSTPNLVNPNVILAQHVKGTGVSSAANFGTGGTVSGNNIAANAPNVITFLIGGSYMIAFYYSSQTSVAYSTPTYAGVTRITSINYNSGDQYGGSSTQNFSFYTAVNAVVGGTITGNFTVVGTTICEYVIASIGGTT